MTGVDILDARYLPNPSKPIAMAFTLHVLLFIWNPALMSSNPLNHLVPPMEVKYLDTMPVMPTVAPPAVPKPLPKPVEKHAPPKKAHRSGLSPVVHAAPVFATHHHAAPAPVHKPFVSKIVIPKFVPHELDDQPISASPAPGISIAAPHQMVNAAHQAPRLKSRTRGVVASDVSFTMTDRGALAGGESAIAIPVGEERGELAQLPSGTGLHEAPRGIHAATGYVRAPGNGAGTGELAGTNKGYFGVAHADRITDGSDDANMAAAEKVAHTSASGQGFDIGGPVGDRKILQRKLPEYPDWAEEKGISAMVKIYFTVRPDGSIRPSMRILRSSGYTELDQLAKDALAKWHFSPTSASSSAEDAWGVITFRFTLN